MTDFEKLTLVLNKNNTTYQVKSYDRFKTVSFKGITIDFYRGGKHIGTYINKGSK